MQPKREGKLMNRIPRNLGVWLHRQRHTIKDRKELELSAFLTENVPHYKRPFYYASNVYRSSNIIKHISRQGILSLLDRMNNST
jgi:hypothetical protein